MTSDGETCRDRHVDDAVRFSTTTSWNPSFPIIESGSSNLSSHRLDPGSILIISRLSSKALRLNMSGDTDKSRSTTPSEHKLVASEPSWSFDSRILHKLFRYVSSNSHGYLRNIHNSIQITSYVDGGLQQIIVHRSVSVPLYSQPPSQLVPTEPRTRSGSRTRSRRTALQAPRVTGLNQSEDTNNPVFHRT